MVFLTTIQWEIFRCHDECWTNPCFSSFRSILWIGSTDWLSCSHFMGRCLTYGNDHHFLVLSRFLQTSFQYFCWIVVDCHIHEKSHQAPKPKVLYRWTGKKLAQCLWSSETRSSNYGGKREAMRTRETRRHSAQPPYVAINQWHKRNIKNQWYQW